MKYSIVVPVYNVERYLPECLDSILCQTFKDYELILIDDGSIDSSSGICDEYAGRNERVTVIHKTNGGLSSARNSGIDAAVGDYIIFMDSDDYWGDERFLEESDAILTEHKTDVLIFNYCKVWPDGKKKPCFGNKIKRAECLDIADIVGRNLWTTSACNKIIRRELLDDTMHFVESITNEDLDWCVRLTLKAESYAYFGEKPVYFYRQGRPDSITYRIDFDNFIRNVEKSAEIISKSNNTELYYFLSYPYSALIFEYSLLDDDRKKQYSDRMKSMEWLLNYAVDRKAKLIQASDRIVGFDNTVRIMTRGRFVCHVLRRQKEKEKL